MSQRLASAVIAMTTTGLVLAGFAVGIKLIEATPPAMFVAPLPSPSASGSPSPAPSTIPTLLTVPAMPPKIAIYGDSQGQTLLYYAPKDLSKYGKFSDHSIEGCGILIGKVTSSSGEIRNLTNCNRWLELWQERAAAVKPEIALVMIGAWDVFDIRQETGLLKFGTPEFDVHWVGELHKGISVLQASGAQVALGLMPCFRPVAKNAGRGAGYWPERGIDERTRHLNQLISDVAQLRKLPLVHPPAGYCTDPKMASDRTLRWDGLHFSAKGSQHYFMTILPQLLAMQ